MKHHAMLHAVILALAAVASSATATTPDLSGTYDVGTLTPLQRPPEFGDNLYLTAERAAQIAQGMQQAMAADAAPLDPNRPPPPTSNQVNKGYNMFWVDPGSTAMQVDGKFRTSIITHPGNGQIPAMTPSGAARLSGMLERWEIVWRNPDPTTSKDGGSAWWLNDGNPDGPYDHIEQRPLAERCIIGSRSTAGPPMLPNFYNNTKRVIQTDQHIMILTEMNHDARVVRLNATHRPAHVRSWLGDSIGWWEDETLVVDTTNFGATPPLSGSDENLHVVERFTRRSDGSLLYAFTIEDPTVWPEAWGGEYVWQPNAGKVYEYACHEGNYAIGNILRGARQLEKSAAQAAATR